MTYERIKHMLQSSYYLLLLRIFINVGVSWRCAGITNIRKATQYDELFLFFINEIFFLLINMSIFDYHDIIIMIITYYHDTLDCDAIGIKPIVTYSIRAT